MNYVNRAPQDYVRVAAPDRREIMEITDLSVLDEGLSNAEDRVIEIETQLEWLEDADHDPHLRHRRVKALIFWKIAVKEYMKQGSYLNSQKRN